MGRRKGVPRSPRARRKAVAAASQKASLMARIELLPDVFEDLDRIFDHLAQHDIEGTRARIAEILAAIDVLATNPQIGRPAREDRRELVIGAGSRGYVALYAYVLELDAVFALALRARKESGYKHV